MKAKYFYDRLCGYGEECKRTMKFYYGYANGITDIHRKGNNTEYYTIYRNGDVYKNTINPQITDIDFRIEDLVGDDFELYNPVQVFKSGYIVLKNAKTEKDVKKVISKLCHYINTFELKKDISLLSGEIYWDNGLTDGFNFYTATQTQIELEILTVKNLCKENVDRKYYGARVYPFNRRMKNYNSFYVKFIHNVKNDIDKKRGDALTELRQYLKEIDIDHEWVDMNIKHPIYC